MPWESPERNRFVGSSSYSATVQKSMDPWNPKLTVEARKWQTPVPSNPKPNMLFFWEFTVSSLSRRTLGRQDSIANLDRKLTQVLEKLDLAPGLNYFRVPTTQILMLHGTPIKALGPKNEIFG